MDETGWFFVLAEFVAAAIGFATAWLMRGREVRKSREAVVYMRDLWARLSQAPEVGAALRARRRPEGVALKLIRVDGQGKRASA